jgi:lipopolysaccharide export LptBFGC system permease protein LptF
MKSSNLIKCIQVIENYKKINPEDTNKNFFKGCNNNITNAITEEFLKRFFAPLFIILIGLSSSLIVTSSKDNQGYKFKNSIKFFLGVILLIVSEISLSYSIKSSIQLISYFLIPIVLFFIIYLFLYINLKYSWRN